jgi:uncharacterized membrane protein
LDINAGGDIVGSTTVAGLTHGFLRTADGAIATIDYPGAQNTFASGINPDGVIVGFYAMAVVPGPLTERHGYILRDGVFTALDPDGAPFVNPLGINAEGEVTGRYCTTLPCNRPGSGNYHGFRWRDGELLVFDVPNSRETNAWKSNPRGDIVGGFRELGGPNRLYLLQGEEFTLFDLPGLFPVTQDNGGINARGDIVGTYCDVAPCNLGVGSTHGFLIRDGALTTIDFPGAVRTSATAINPSGEITGFYNAGGIGHGYVLTHRH